MHLTFYKLKLRERGDTIVEVLIAIGVLSLILGGAFVITNRSLQGSRQAQERQNALKLAESQVEQIKNLATTNGAALFAAAMPACITSAGTIVGASNATCAVNTDGAPTAAEPIFHLSITRSGNTFTVRNTWANVRGSGNDLVELKYRVYD
jgi:Tfp pilus assembly protein PilV